MPAAPYLDVDGRRSEVELTPEIFDVQVNVPVMHEVVRAQLAAGRSGTHSTKTRGEVTGGGRKPWRQKGTGRARHGSIREPQWVGGGIAHGPKPRDYSMRTNKKVRALALRSALTDRARAGTVLVVEVPPFERPETKRAVELLVRWGATGKTLLVMSREEVAERETAWKSFRNLPQVLMVSYPTAYAVLRSDTVVFTRAALDALTASAASSATPTSEPSAGPGEDAGEGEPE